jgi:DNA-binding MarR family transcriptional regulator
MGLASFVLAIMLVVPQCVTIVLAQSVVGPRISRNLATKVLVDSKGAIHVLWTVPPLNKSGSTPGVWYGKYEPNGSDAIPPTLIRNSSVVQAADMALDRFNHAHITWAEGPAFADSRNGVNVRLDSRLYYGEINSTDPGNFAATPITGPGKLVLSPSLAIDDNLTSHIVWTQLEEKTEPTGGTYYGSIRHNTIISNTTLVSNYNVSFSAFPTPHLAFDRISSNLHLAWAESNVLATGRVTSVVDYAQVDLRTRNVTRLQLARFNATAEDPAVTSGPGGNAYVVWQQSSDASSARSVYVAQISRNGRIVFIKQLAQPASQKVAPLVTASEDNLYVVWYEPAVFPSHPADETDRPTTSVAFLKLDRDGSLAESGSEVVPGPLIAVTVSSSGGLFAVSPSGILQIPSPVNALNVGLIGAAIAASGSTVASAFAIEEVRYRALLSVARLVKRLGRRRERHALTEDFRVLRALSRNPGLRLDQLRDLLRRDSPTMLMLALLELEGYVSSVRTGIVRRFYAGRNTDSSNGILDVVGYETIPSRIVREIDRNPGIWEAKLAQNLELSQQIVHYHLRKLHAAGSLTMQVLDRRKHYRVRGSSHNPDATRFAS